jgi:hypothetical protein
MPRLSPYNRVGVAATLKAQDQLITRRQARAYGMSASTLRYKVRVGGPWQVVLPGVYLAQTGYLRRTQRDVAAFLLAGCAIAVTGVVAADRHGIPCKPGELVDVLVPRGCRHTDAGFVRLHRTAVIPKTYTAGFVTYAAPARAVADAVRQLEDMSEVRALVAAGVQRGKIGLPELAAELAAGPKRGSARLRAVLAEVADGVRSSAEGDLRTLIKRAELPVPMFNPKLYVGAEFLASPDAWWRELAVAAEVDSKQWHFSPEDWERTLARHARMTAQGILVLHFPPAKVRDQPWLVVREIRSALASSRGPLQHIRTVPVSTR